MHVARRYSPLAPITLSRIQLFALIGLAATALALLTTAQAGVALAHEGHAVPWIGLFKARLVDWYTCALFMPVLCGLARRYPVDAQRWARHLPILLLAAVPVALAKETIFVAIGDFFRPGVFDLATILAEDFGDEVIAVWAMLGVSHLLVSRKPTLEPKGAGISVRTRHGPEWIPIQDIEFVDAQGNYARLVTSKGRFLVRQTMAELERRLGRDFVRVHRSVIVRRDRVTNVEPAANGRSWITLASGKRLASGRSYRAAAQTLVTATRRSDLPSG